MRLYDAHNHLQDARIAAREEEFFRDYERAGVASVVVNGTGPQDWPLVASLGARRETVLPSYGLHPWQVNGAPADWRESFEAQLEADPRAGVGEIGLDRWIRDHDLPAQQAAFRFQLELAARENRPASIHCLHAWGPLLETLQSTRLPERGFLIHSYGGSREMIGQFAGLGAYFSVSAYFAHPRKAPQAEVFKEIPLERLLVETDAPDMLGPTELVELPLNSPEGEAVNHPGNIAAIYRFAARLRGMQEAEFADQAASNWLRLFGPE